MIDYFVIVYLMKRFGYDRRFNKSQLFNLKVFLFAILSAISLVRIVFFNVSLFGLYAGPLAYMGYFQEWGYFILVVFFYAGLLLLPFLIIILMILGITGTYFAPRIYKDAALEEYKQACEKDKKYVGSINCYTYHSKLSRAFNVKLAVDLTNKELTRIYEFVKAGQRPPCDPVKDQVFLKDFNWADCKKYQNIERTLIINIADFLMWLPQVDPQYWSWMASGEPGRAGLIDTYEEWSNGECVKKCENLPHAVRESGRVPDFKVGLNGKSIYPLKCKWRCENRQNIMDLGIKWGKIGCSMPIQKSIANDHFNVCRGYVGFLRGKYRASSKDNIELREAELMLKQASDF